jgi:outer membrane scaffolding protein for murein synthesis (MipA/OmpV family)
VGGYGQASARGGGLEQGNDEEPDGIGSGRRRMAGRALTLSASCGGAATVAAALLAAPAQAQTPTPLTNWQLSVGEVLAKQQGPVPDWRVALGAGALVEPLYEGSKRYQILPSAVIDIRYRDIAFFSAGEGLGVNVFRGEDFRAGVAFDYDLGRDHHIQHRLTGLGNVEPAPEAKIFFEYFLKAVVLNLDLRQGIGGNDGLVGDVGIYVPVPVPPVDGLFVFTGPSVSLADDRYMEAYFGVTPAQAARSDFAAFTAQGGFYRSGWGLTAIYRIGDHWVLEAEGAWEYLLGDAGSSPIVEERSEFESDVNVIYRF